MNDFVGIALDISGDDRHIPVTKSLIPDLLFHGADHKGDFLHWI